ncbi:hypothetical protein CHH70_17360 [Shouchella clausii]|nr:hypothetical protein CHH70_17360 [Shouchella clausii]
MFKYTLKNYYVRFITHEGYTIMECGFNYNELLPKNEHFKKFVTWVFVFFYNEPIIIKSTKKNKKCKNE